VGGKAPFLLSSLFFTSMLLGGLLPFDLGDLTRRSSSQWCLTAAAVESVPARWDAMYMRSHLEPCCHCAVGVLLSVSSMDLHGNVSSWKDLCNFSVPGCVTQKMRSNNRSVQPLGIKMIDSLRRQSCDYTDLSRESAWIRSSAPGICLRSWHLD